MKTTKKIFAAFLAVMMIALMIPFTASAATAADSYTVTLDSSYTVTTEKGQETKYRDGFTVSIYKVASLDTETGKYTLVDGWSDEVKTALESKTSDNGVNSAALLAKLNKDYNRKTAVDTWTINSSARTKNLTVYKEPDAEKGELGFGVYFIAWTGYPDNATVASFNNTVVSLPYYGIVGDDGAAKDWIGINTINLGTKVNTGEPNITKEFVNRNDVFTDTDGKNSVTEFTGENNTIGFKLTGSVTGTNDVPSTSYKITDTYTNGLTVNFDDNFKVALVKIDNNQVVNEIELQKGADKDYTIATGTTADNKKVFTVELTDNALNKDTDFDKETTETQNFYSFTNVVVTYNGYLNDNAVNVKTINDVELKYSQRADKYENTVPGDEVHLYSFSLDVVKVDANNTSTKLNGAGFTLYTDSACTPTSVATNGAEQVTSGTEVVNNKEVAKGLATFTGLKAGTYYLKETTAPTGYNINSTVYEINIATDGKVTSKGTTVTQIEVPDTPLVTPKTGGMGTMMFTIGGAALIACAGVLFLIVRKKKSAK